MDQKNDKIQVLRGLAIIAVVLIHTCPGGMWQVICRPFLNFAVAMFLFLSGYLTKSENDNWADFFKKRIMRVIIPYIIWTVIYSIPHFTFKGLAVNLITTWAAPTLYYIFVYIQFVLLTPIIGKLAKSKWQWIGWIIAPISIIVFKYYWLLSGQTLNQYVSTAWGLSCLGWFTYYYLGLVLGNSLLKHPLNSRVALALLLVSLPVQMAEGYGLMLMGNYNYGSQMKMSVFLTSSMFLLLAYYWLVDDRYTPRTRILSFLGDWSFGIYLSHMVVIRILNLIPFCNSIPFPVNSAIVLVISAAGVYFGGKICGKRISRYIGLR